MREALGVDAGGGRHRAVIVILTLHSMRLLINDWGGQFHDAPLFLLQILFLSRLLRRLLLLGLADGDEFVVILMRSVMVVRPVHLFLEGIFF